MGHSEALHKEWEVLIIIFETDWDQHDIGFGKGHWFKVNINIVNDNIVVDSYNNVEDISFHIFVWPRKLWSK